MLRGTPDFEIHYVIINLKPDLSKEDNRPENEESDIDLQYLEINKKQLG